MRVSPVGLQLAPPREALIPSRHLGRWFIMKRSRDIEHSFPSNRRGFGTDITNHGGPGRAKTPRTRSADDDARRSPLRKWVRQECFPVHPKEGKRRAKGSCHVVKTGVVLCSAPKASCVQCATRLQYTKKANDCALLVIDHPRIGRIFIRPIYLGRLSTSRTRRSMG